MLSITDVSKILNVDKPSIHNRLRKKKYSAYLKKDSKEKYITKEGFKLLKEEFEMEIEEVAAVIVNDPEEFTSFGIENIESEEVIYLKERIKNLEEMLKNQNTIIIQQQKLQLKQYEVHNRELTKTENLLLEKKQELLDRQEKYLKEKNKKWWLFWK